MKAGWKGPAGVMAVVGSGGALSSCPFAFRQPRFASSDESVCARCSSIAVFINRKAQRRRRRFKKTMPPIRARHSGKPSDASPGLELGLRGEASSGDSARRFHPGPVGNGERLA